MYCRKHGGILAKETSEEVTLFFKHELLVLSDALCFWIGLNDKGDAGNWRWSDGKVLSYPYVNLSITPLTPMLYPINNGSIGVKLRLS